MKHFIVLIAIVTFICAQQCFMPGSPSPARYTDLGRCAKYESQVSCCNTETVAKAFQGVDKKSCNQSPVQECLNTYVPFMCFLYCDTNVTAHFKDLKFRFCKSYADQIFNACKDSVQCVDPNAKCANEETSTEGCQKIADFFKTSKEFVEKQFNATYVEDNQNCFSSASKHGIAVGLVFVLIALLGFM